MKQKKGFIGKAFTWLEKTRAGRTVLDTAQAIPIPILPQLITSARKVVMSREAGEETLVVSPVGHVQWKRSDTWRALLNAFILVGIMAGWFKVETVEKVVDMVSKVLGIIESTQSLMEPLFIILPV